AEQRRLAVKAPARFIHEVIGPGLPRRLLAIEAQAMLAARQPPLTPLRRRETAAGAGIERPVRSMRGIGRGGDIGTGAEAGIDQSARIEPVEFVAVIGEMVGLAPHLAVPSEAEPGEVVEHRGLVLALAAADVDVLDAHQKGAAGLACTIQRDLRRVSRY